MNAREFFKTSRDYGENGWGTWKEEGLEKQRRVRERIGSLGDREKGKESGGTHRGREEKEHVRGRDKKDIG